MAIQFRIYNNYDNIVITKDDGIGITDISFTKSNLRLERNQTEGWVDFKPLNQPGIKCRWEETIDPNTSSAFTNAGDFNTFISGLNIYYDVSNSIQSLDNNTNGLPTWFGDANSYLNQINNKIDKLINNWQMQGYSDNIDNTGFKLIAPVTLPYAQPFVDDTITITPSHSDDWGGSTGAGGIQITGVNSAGVLVSETLPINAQQTPFTTSNQYCCINEFTLDSVGSDYINDGNIPAKFTTSNTPASQIQAGECTAMVARYFTRNEQDILIKHITIYTTTPTYVRLGWFRQDTSNRKTLWSGIVNGVMNVEVALTVSSLCEVYAEAKALAGSNQKINIIVSGFSSI